MSLVLSKQLWESAGTNSFLRLLFLFPRSWAFERAPLKENIRFPASRLIFDMLQLSLPAALKIVSTDVVFKTSLEPEYSKVMD
jgi:hypothetical protein